MTRINWENSKARSSRGRQSLHTSAPSTLIGPAQEKAPMRAQIMHPCGETIGTGCRLDHSSAVPARRHRSLDSCGESWALPDPDRAPRAISWPAMLPSTWALRLLRGTAGAVEHEDWPFPDTKNASEQVMTAARARTWAISAARSFT